MSIKNYPELITFEEHFERCYKYICERINSDEKFDLWTNNPILISEGDKFQKEYLDKDYAKKVYKKVWDKMLEEEGIDKIRNYYEDY